MERPVGMIAQFLVPLVESVGRSEEGNRVGDMNCDWHIQLSAGVPHRVEPGIVDLYQPPGGKVLSQIEAQRLQDLETTSSIAVSLFDRLSLQLRIVRLQK